MQEFNYVEHSYRVGERRGMRGKEEERRKKEKGKEEGGREGRWARKVYMIGRNEEKIQTSCWINIRERK